MTTLLLLIACFVETESEYPRIERFLNLFPRIQIQKEKKNTDADDKKDRKSKTKVSPRRKGPLRRCFIEIVNGKLVRN